MTKQERAEQKAERQQARERIERAIAEARSIVEKGVCPRCGRALRRNLALAGWWQCEQFGAVGWRKDSSADSCNWQGFTE